MMEDFISNYGAWFGAASAFVLLFDRVAKMTPTKTDDKIVAILYKVFAVLGMKVKDNEGN